MRGRLTNNHFYLLLDTGVDANFTYLPSWATTSSITYDHLTITKLRIEDCKPIYVNPTFGDKIQITKRILLQFTIDNSTLNLWFYLLLYNKSCIIIGKPQLKKLNYYLSKFSESVIIDNKKIDLSPLLSQICNHKLFNLSTFTDPLLSELKNKFYQELSPQIHHDYVAHITLKDFPYHKPKTYFTA